mgnify:CR=1 FL=1
MYEKEAPNCVFCKIIRNELKSKIILEDEHVIVIEDLSPKAPIHLLLIPKAHVPTINHIEDEKLYSIFLRTAQKIALKLNVSEDGYRLIMNCNKMGGQSVYHVHMHFLAGKQMEGF